MGIQDVEIIVPLKYLSNFWRTLEMSLINCEVNLILTWSKDCVITNSEGEAKFAITETKLYVPVVTLSTQDNAKLLQQLKSGFKRTINWNKYESNIKTFAQNRYLNHLINPSFQGVNRLFVLSFENEDDRTFYDLFDQPINNNFKTYEKIRKIAFGQGDHDWFFVRLFLFQRSLQNDCNRILKQQALDADPRAIQQIYFTANLHRDGNMTMFFIIEEAKETVLDFSQGTIKVL